MPFAAIWMDLEIIILGEVNQRKTNTAITYMWNIKNDMPIASAVFHYGCSLGQRSSFLISWFISNVPCDSSFFPPPSYASLISVKFLIGIKEKEEQWHNGKR